MGLGNIARQLREGPEEKGASPGPIPTPEELGEKRERAQKLAAAFLSLDEQIKKLQGLKKETENELLPLIKIVGDEDKKTQERKSLGLAGGVRIVIGKTGGGKHATKTAIVKEFKEAGNKFWNDLEPAPSKEALQIKTPLDLGPDPEAE